MAPGLKKRKEKYENRKEKRKCVIDAQNKEIVKFPSKTENEKRKVSDLVYEYLAQVANVYNRRQQRNNARSNFHRAHLRKQPRNIYPNHQSKKKPKQKSIFDDNLTKNISSFLPFACDTSFCQFQSPAVTKTIVNNYSKAVNEGRNIARKFVCKALSFGVNSGFLLPTDDKGQMLRVSSNLCLFAARQKSNKNIKKQRKSTNLKNIKRKRLTKSKSGKRSFKTAKTVRFRAVKKETKKRKTK